MQKMVAHDERRLYVQHEVENNEAKCVQNWVLLSSLRCSGEAENNRKARVFCLMDISENNNMPRFLPGDLVEVRSLPEIFATLDERGILEELPFMPEMVPYCGSQWRVWRRVEKTCVEGDRVRRLENVVFLDIPRCNGASHDGCGKECRFFWHEAWLRTTEETGQCSVNSESPGFFQFPYPTKIDGSRYLCQSTQLLLATRPLWKLDLRQYYREWRAKTYPVKQFVRFLLTPFWVRIKVLIAGMSEIQLRGTLSKTPTESLNLQPGELVEVKNREEIARTLDSQGRNRGLEFSRFMLPFCGRRLTVQKRVSRIILETTGEMREIKNTVILENSTCDGCTRWGGCPRDAQHLWREIWLKRMPRGKKGQATFKGLPLINFQSGQP